jgi:hypothetical protein
MVLGTGSNWQPSAVGLAGAVLCCRCQDLLLFVVD